MLDVIVRGLQIKTRMIYHSIPIGMTGTGNWQYKILTGMHSNKNFLIQNDVWLQKTEGQYLLMLNTFLPYNSHKASCSVFYLTELKGMSTQRPAPKLLQQLYL